MNSLTPKNSGFTLIELVAVIVLLGILSVTAVVKWPSGMTESAAVGEFKRAVRYAQHLAITRQFTDIASAWGIAISSNRYTVQRRGTNCTSCGVDCAPDFCNRALLDDGSITITGGSVWFNGLGAPFADDLSALSDTTFTITESSGTNVLIYGETGYVQ